LTVIPFGFQPSISVPEIRVNTDARWYSESDAGIRELSEAVNAYGMKLIIKPQLWLRGGWSAEIDFTDEAAWKQWEAQYHTFMMHYAHLAAAAQADLLCIGTELSIAVRKRPAFFRQLIADIRAVYDGKLTYAANWHEDYQHVAFWDALDYIGVQAYFPLSSEPDPSLDLLKKGWTPHLKALRKLQAQVDRPLLLTEIGYRSVPYAAAEPWRWPSRDENGTLDPDYELQARLYQAFFERLWEEPWLAGIIVWKWHPENETRRREGRELNFTPQQKPAADIIQKWFKK